MFTLPMILMMLYNCTMDEAMELLHRKDIRDMLKEIVKG